MTFLRVAGSSFSVRIANEISVAIKRSLDRSVTVAPFTFRIACSGIAEVAMYWSPVEMLCTKNICGIFIKLRVFTLRGSGGTTERVCATAVRRGLRRKYFKKSMMNIPYSKSLRLCNIRTNPISQNEYELNTVLLLREFQINNGMEIIKFPKKNNKLVDIVTTEENKLSIGGPLRFSCDCGTTAELSFKNVIFRHIDFYCSSCGAHYKVTNPAFKAPTVPPRKK